jgi:hypothetical protein
MEQLEKIGASVVLAVVLAKSNSVDKQAIYRADDQYCPVKHSVNLSSVVQALNISDESQGRKWR